MDLSKRQKQVKTVFLVLVWVCLGLYLEITGPTLIDLKIKTGADYEEVAVAVSGRSAGYFIGSAIGGVLVDRWVGYCDLMIGVCLTGGAVATAIVPWARSVEILWFFIVLQGTFEGVINIAGQKLILLLWTVDAASPLHILHGGFGIGSFIIPLIANPFLAAPKPSGTNNSTALGSRLTINASSWSLLDNSSTATNTSANPFTANSPALSPSLTSGAKTDYRFNASVSLDEELQVDSIEYIRESRIEYPYMISAICTLLMSVVFYLYQFNKKASRETEVKTSTITKQHSRSGRFLTRCKTMVNPATCANGNLIYGAELLVFMFLYFVNIVGGERILGKFIRAYAIEQLGFSVAEGSYINTAFWISFAIGRISGFIAARYIPIRKFVIIETSGVLLFSILLNIFAVNNSLSLWILIQPLGLFHAPCFPSMIGWGDYHVEMTGMAITFLLLGGSIGGVAYLKLTGYLFEHHGPRAFLYHILGYGITCLALAILLDVLGAQKGGRFSDDKHKPGAVRDTNKVDSEETEMAMLHREL